MSQEEHFVIQLSVTGLFTWRRRDSKKVEGREPYNAASQQAGSNTVGLLEGGELGREAGRIGEGPRRREGSFEASFTSPQHFPDRPCGAQAGGGPRKHTDEAFLFLSFCFSSWTLQKF